MGKKITLLLILIILFMGCVQEEKLTTSTSTQKTTTTIAQGMKEYVNYEQGFSLQYPAGFETKENVEGSTVLFISPEQDRFLENINVFVGKSNLSRLSQEELTGIMEKHVRQKIGNNTEIEKTNTTIGQKNASELIYSGEKQKRELKWKQAYTSIEEKIVIITYTAEKQEFEEQTTAYEKIKETFSMKK